MFIVGGGVILFGDDDPPAGVSYTAPTNAPVASDVKDACLALVSAEAGDDADACRPPASSAEEPRTDLESGSPTPRATDKPIDRKTDNSTERVADRADSGPVPSAPSTPGSPSTPTSPGDTAPGSPGATHPVGPGTTTPPAPTTPTVPAPPQPPPARASLGFTGISENTTIGLLGIRLLSSYTLSLSGEPGQTATVWYGSARAGTVTFDDGGRSSITLGGSLINLGLGNPLIRASYSDGSGETQAYRNSI